MICLFCLYNPVKTGTFIQKYTKTYAQFNMRIIYIIKFLIYYILCKQRIAGFSKTIKERIGTMNLTIFENDLFRKTIYNGDVVLSPKVMELSEPKLVELFRRIQEFFNWRNEAIETHSFGILELERKRYIFSISKEGYCKTLNIRRVGEFF